MRIKEFLFLILFSVCITSSYAQLSESATISVLTVRQGESADNVFGHTAVWVVDPVTKKNEIYNFGIFDFDEPGFLMKFLRGKLLYNLGINSKKGFFNAYVKQRRTILEQKLNLRQDQKNKIYLSLRENYKPENRRYLYDFFFDNCSTRPRDLLYNNLPQLKETVTEVPTKTFRDLIDENVFSSPWMDFGIDLIIGKKADKIASVQDQMYLPEYFHKKLNNLNNGDVPLVSSDEIILDFEKQAAERKESPWFSPSLLFGLLLLLELFLFIKYRNKKNTKWLNFYDKFWFTLTSISSLAILFMWFGTDHIATKDNLNVLWLNPIFFLLIFGRLRWVQILTAFLLIVAIIVGVTIQKFHIASILIICILLLKLIRQLSQANTQTN
ncbi:DUF4105 domain-containing protein [Saprospiraceae bacterium]|nr:DUF4105 domain-containing protein [Saprospiraceae bacterium]